LLKLIKKESYFSMPWKNGLGNTLQIAIYPETASFPGDDFYWRLSSATVKSAGPFSMFPGCDRWLTILSKAGFVLNGSELSQLKPRHFSGEIPLRSELPEGEVTDLGLIYRRNKVRAQMSVEVLMSARTLFYDRGVYLFYCVAGDLKINEVTASPQETIQLTGPFEVTLSTTARAQYVLIQLTT
jgi:environmental stress-induced protein Ves